MAKIQKGQAPSSGNVLHPSAVIVSATGGNLDLVSGDGEILAQIAVPPGRHRASIYTDLVGPGEALQIGEGLVSFPPRNLCAVTQYPDEINRQSDANPHWSASHLTDGEKRMRALMVRKREMTTRTQRRAAAQKSLDDMRAAAMAAAEAARMATEAAVAAEAAEKAAKEAPLVE